jgi:tetratricopeptide (TPR) repeat protein
LQPFLLLPATGSDEASGWLKLAIENHTANKFPDAERCYRQALVLSPNNVAATCNLGILHAATGQTVEAVHALDRAAIFAPKDPLVLANRAMMKLQVEDIEGGLESALKAVGLTSEKPAANDPVAVAGYLLSRLALAMLSATSGHPEQALPLYHEMLAVDPKHPAAGPNACFITSLMDVGPEVLRRERDAWYTANRYSGAVWPHGNDKTPMAEPCPECIPVPLLGATVCDTCHGRGTVGRPLRVGYVGGDFKSHSAAMMFSNVLLQHSPAVIPYFYCSLPTDPIADDLTQKFQFAAGRLRENPEDGPPLVVPDGHRWRDIYNLSDEAVDDQIRKDGIDILVDLAGHTNGGRLGVFCRKPAPVQVTAWGFAHGTGVPTIDYFFADPVAVPESERPHYAERIFDLPSIVTYRPPVEYGIKTATPLPYYSNEFITFASFSRYEKLSDDCLAAFAEILRRVPDSRLFLKDHAYRRPYSVRRVLDALEGIDPSRVLFGIATAHHEHIGTYSRCDLYLDPFPHGSGIVALEVLFAGVPMVTLNGKQPAGRTASSVLTVMGRTDWIAKTREEYVEKAVEWAGRPADLAKARKTLSRELVESPVVQNYPKKVEEAFRLMWQEWCAKG